MMARYSISGSHLMDIAELQQVQPHTLLRFAKASKDLYNLVLRVAHWRETDYGLSTGQHAVLHECKGKASNIHQVSENC